MKYLFNHLVAILAAILLCVGARGQNAPVKSYVPPSPTAASLGIYGQAPINEATGSPSIQIPLYTIETDGFKLPLDISYGIEIFTSKPRASWVGLGWNLNFGGIITREKRHKDDLAPNGFYTTPASPGCGDNIDQEPDMFYYNFNGHSGAFILDRPTGSDPFTIRKMIKDNTKIAYDAGKETWILTSDDGVQYVFSDKEYTTDHTTSSPVNNDQTETYTSSWYISKIILPDNNKILFSYRTDIHASSVQSYSSYFDSQVSQYYPSQLANTCCIANALLRTGSASTTDVSTDEKVLSEINFPTGKLVFTTSTRADITAKAGSDQSQKLDKIDVYNLLRGNYSLIGTFQLAFDYLPSSTSPVYLKLLSVTEGLNGTTKPPYSFQYASNYLINKVTYPTGGRTEYVFESQAMGRGFRVQQVSDYDPDNAVNIKRFEYTGGKAFNGEYTTYATDKTTNVHFDSAQCCNNITPLTGYYIRHNTVLFDLYFGGCTVAGANVGYDKVTTYYGLNGENGKKESYFYNTAPAPSILYDQASQMPVPVPTDIPSQVGQLLDEYIYANQGGTYVLLSHQQNTYEAAEHVSTQAHRYAYGKCADWSYTIGTDWLRVSSSKTEKYDQNGLNPVSFTSNYYYDRADNVNPTRVVTTDSKGNTVQATYHYVNEKAASVGGVYTQLLSKNMIKDPVDVDQLKNGTTIQTTATSYKDWWNNGRVIAPEITTVKRGSATPSKQVQFLSYEENNLIAGFALNGGKPVSYIYGYGNSKPIAEVSNVIPNTVAEAQSQNYFYGRFINISPGDDWDSDPFTTNYGQTITMSIEVILAGLQQDGNILVYLVDQDGKYLKSLNYTTPNTYTETAVIPSGTGTYHFHVHATAIRATTARIQFTVPYNIAKYHKPYFHTSFEEETSAVSQEAKTGIQSHIGMVSIPMPWTAGKYILSYWDKPSGSGTWTYHEQTLDLTGTPADLTIGSSNNLIDEVRLYPVDALMTSYTYGPGLNMTSKCDERNRVIYYEYDDLQRLTTIRDNEKNITKTFDYNYKH